MRKRPEGPPYLYKEGTANLFYRPRVRNKNVSFPGLLAPNNAIVKLQEIPCPVLDLGGGGGFNKGLCQRG